MIRASVPIILIGAFMTARSQDANRARELYQNTEYRASLDILVPIVHKGSSVFGLIGQNYFMLGQYNEAIEALTRATAMEPNNAGFVDWLGRAYGRRAESGSLTAPTYATKARQMFERSVALDPFNKEALNDLFNYYLRAPKFLGGGIEKAQELTRRIAWIDPAEGHYAQAMIADERKDYDAAEQNLRVALKLAPANPKRAMDLAIFLASHGRLNESDAMFDQAAAIAPYQVRLLFERANVYISTQRNLEDARRLLQRYIHSQLTPDDPPRGDAEVLLRKIGACCS